MNTGHCDECSRIAYVGDGWSRNRLCGHTSVTRVRLNAGGYAPGKSGAYFGQGAPLYRADDESGEQRYVRATNRAEAVRMLKASNPHMKARAS